MAPFGLFRFFRRADARTLHGQENVAIEGRSVVEREFDICIDLDLVGACYNLNVAGCDLSSGASHAEVRSIRLGRGIADLASARGVNHARDLIFRNHDRLACQAVGQLLLVEEVDCAGDQRSLPLAAPQFIGLGRGRRGECNKQCSAGNITKHLIPLESEQV